MMIAVICQEYHWTYEEYMNTPSWFLELIKIKYKLDGERMKREIEKSQQR